MGAPYYGGTLLITVGAPLYKSPVPNAAFTKPLYTDILALYMKMNM